MISYAIFALALASASTLDAQAGDFQLQFTPGQLIDGIVDWTNAGIDSFGPLAEGPQQAQFIDVFVDWINSLVDTPSHSPPTNPGKSFPSA